MKKLIAFFALLNMYSHSFAQCTTQSTLTKNNSPCINSDTLFVSSTGSISKITWYKNNIADTTVIADSATVVTTVAGSNGNGSALNQLNFPAGIFIDTAGNMYVCDNENNRVLKFPPGSTGKTNGQIVAGGNGNGAALNQL